MRKTTLKRRDESAYLLKAVQKKAKNIGEFIEEGGLDVLVVTITRLKGKEFYKLVEVNARNSRVSTG